MTIEALWYREYRDGERPRCTRYCRLPMAQQWLLTIDLAIAYAAGSAGYHNAVASKPWSASATGGGCRGYHG
jgi:hypothetical protein